MAEGTEARLAWITDVLAILYFVWNYSVLARHTRALGGTFQGLGVEVPGPTAFVLAHHAWLYPTVFVGASLLLVGKEMWLGDKRLSAGVTFLIALVVLWVTDFFRAVLTYPLFTMFEKLT